MIVSPSALLLQLLTAEVGMSGAYNGATIHLFVNDFTPSPTSALGDFTDCTATGYTPGSVTWDTPSLNDNLQAEVYGNVFETIFSAGATELPTIYGFYLVGSDTTTLLGSARYDTPVAITRNGQSHRVLPQLVKAQ